MERRKKPRLKVTQPVTLLALDARRSRLIEACVMDISGNGVKVRSPIRLACDTQVKIEGEDTLMLGKVCRCEAYDGAYVIGIQLSNPLPSLIELELLNRALIGPGRVVKVEAPSELHEEKNLVPQIKT